MTEQTVQRTKSDVDEIRKALDVLVTPGHIVEVRAPEAVSVGYSKPHTIAGYFDCDHLDDLAKLAAKIDAPAIYVTLNPPDPALLARAYNRLRDPAKETTSDKDIVKLQWLLIDADPIRPAGISSTDEQHEAALALSQKVRADLQSKGWPAPVYADSGNGGHLLYRLNLPTEDSKLLERVLKALAFLYNDKTIAIDTTTFNPARICKLYGTIAGKGDSIPGRPHRLSRLLSVPMELMPVPRGLLEGLAATLPPDPKPDRNGAREQFDLDGWIADHGLSVARQGPWNGGYRWVLADCPWNQEHRNHSAYIVRLLGGAIGAGCHHNGCADNGWQELRDVVEPGWKDRRNGHSIALNADLRSQKSKTAKLPIPCGDGGLGGDGGEADNTPYRLICVDDVEAEEVVWFWEGRFAMGKINLVDGDPGQGKSVMTLDLTARASTGRVMPDGSPGLAEPSGVLLLSAEDDVADTIRPRLEAAGADLGRVSVLNEVRHFSTDEDGNLQERLALPTIPEDLPAMEKAIIDKDVKLVIIDPLMAFLSSEVNSHHDQDVRQALAPLAAMANRTGACIVVVRHLNKMSGGNPLYRGGGSIGIIGAARSGLLVAKDPNDFTGKIRVLASVKCNLAEEPTSMAYHLEKALNGAVRVIWDGATAHTAATLLAVPRTAEEGDALGEAKNFLAESLENGPRLTTDIQKEAKAVGVAWRTIERAKTALGLSAKKRQDNGKWEWRLPDEDATKAAKAANSAISASDTYLGGLHGGDEDSPFDDDGLPF